MNWLSSRYRNNFLLWDWVLPATLASLVLATVHVQFGVGAVQEIVDGNRATVYGALATVAGALLGFAITLVVLVQALLVGDAFRILRSSPYLADLVEALFHGVVAFGLLTLLALIALVVDRDGDPVPALLYLVLVLTAVAVWKQASSTRLVWRVVKIGLMAERAHHRDA